MGVKKLFTASLLLILLVLPALAYASIPARPETLTFVNDFANLLTPNEEQDLTGVLAGIETATSAEVVIVTVRTLGGTDVFAYAQQLFTAWGIGKRDKNNGLLLLVSTQEREFRFHTGYGLEGALPDGHLGSLFRAHIVPSFGEGRFFDGLRGVLMASDGIVVRLEREYNVTIERGAIAPQTTAGPAMFLEGGLNLLVVIVLLLLLSTRGGRGLLWFLLGHSIGSMNRRNRGGPFGGGFGGDLAGVAQAAVARAVAGSLAETHGALYPQEGR